MIFRFTGWTQIVAFQDVTQRGSLVGQSPSTLPIRTPGFDPSLSRWVACGSETGPVRNQRPLLTSALLVAGFTSGTVLRPTFLA